MSQQAINTINAVGNEEDITCNAHGGAVKLLYTGLTAAQRKDRQGVLVKNHHATDAILYKLVNRGAATPSVSTSTNHGAIAAGDDPVFIHAGPGIDIYYISESANTPTATALEVR
jgi:carbamoylphosphate synthase small subunit